MPRASKEAGCKQRNPRVVECQRRRVGGHDVEVDGGADAMQVVLNLVEDGRD